MPDQLTDQLKTEFKEMSNGELFVLHLICPTFNMLGGKKNLRLLMSGDIRVIEDILIVLGSWMNNTQILFLIC